MRLVVTRPQATAARLFMLSGLALLAGVSGLALWCGTRPDNARAFQVVALLSLLVMVTMAWAVIRGYRMRYARLLEMHDEVNRIFRFSADILALVDAKGGVHNLNPAWMQITGRPVALGSGMNLLDAAHPQDVHAHPARGAGLDRGGAKAGGNAAAPGGWRLCLGGVAYGEVAGDGAAFRHWAGRDGG
jgi:PAS domain-containing protein